MVLLIVRVRLRCGRECGDWRKLLAIEKEYRKLEIENHNEVDQVDG